MANAPVSPVYIDPVRLGGTVVKVNIDAREIAPSRVETHRRRGAPPVVGTALATAEALPASGLLAGLIKPPLQHPRRWGLEPMAEKKKGGEVERPSHGKAWHMGPTYRGDRASERRVGKDMTVTIQGLFLLSAHLPLFQIT